MRLVQPKRRNNPADPTGLGRLPIPHTGQPYVDRNVENVPPGAISIMVGYLWGAPGHRAGTFSGFSPITIPHFGDMTSGQAPVAPVPQTPSPVGIVYTESLPVQRLRAPRAGE